MMCMEECDYSPAGSECQTKKILDSTWSTE
jgi:hypothetical protein